MISPMRRTPHRDLSLTSVLRFSKSRPLDGKSVSPLKIQRRFSPCLQRMDSVDRMLELPCAWPCSGWLHRLSVPMNSSRASDSISEMLRATSARMYSHSLERQPRVSAQNFEMPWLPSSSGRMLFALLLLPPEKGQPALVGK